QFADDYLRRLWLWISKRQRQHYGRVPSDHRRGAQSLYVFQHCIATASPTLPRSLMDWQLLFNVAVPIVGGLVTLIVLPWLKSIREDASAAIKQVSAIREEFS